MLTMICYSIVWEIVNIQILGDCYKQLVGQNLDTVFYEIYFDKKNPST